MYFSFDKCVHLTCPAHFQTKSYHFGSKNTVKFAYKSRHSVSGEMAHQLARP